MVWYGMGWDGMGSLIDLIWYIHVPTHLYLGMMMIRWVEGWIMKLSGLGASSMFALCVFVRCLLFAVPRCCFVRGIDCGWVHHVLDCTLWDIS